LLVPSLETYYYGEQRRQRPRWKPTTTPISVASALIGNLAASDLWHCLFCLPIQLHYQLTDRWIFGAVLCRTNSAGGLQNPRRLLE